MWGRGLPTHLILQGPPAVEVVLKRSARAKRLSLRVSGLDRRVSLTLPPRVRLREAEAFLREKESWLRTALARNPDMVRVEPEAEVLFQGAPHVVELATVKAVQVEGDRLLVPGRAPERTGARVEAFLKLQARHRLQAASDLYAARLGLPYGRLTLRDTRSRWGSCSAEGNLNYSWRLIMAPAEVLEYVAAHEVAHLAEMNHSPAFWDVVTRLYGPYAEQRGWLRQHGGQLHRYRFKD
ncbi:M48 family metallopeptidase [Cognatishimia sp. MH4019]|uniref:M48 family metallopeptidase n=1 Tax=Cognatishimia sp. MH4019 TaxID=2854030 RepID=UPI001CD59F1A|nr:SprT family zinc-dependent metalloprotease [Cognatishimia sp. MH4019]